MATFEWAFVVATIGLVVATVVLAVFTRALYKETGRLADTEERRYKEEARGARRMRVNRKLELAEQVIHMPSETLLKPLVLGEISHGKVAEFRKLHEHLDFGSDKVLKNDVDRLLLAFDGGNRGTRYPDAMIDLEPVLERVRERLSWDLVNWREELVELSPEVFLSQDDL